MTLSPSGNRVCYQILNNKSKLKYCFPTQTKQYLCQIDQTPHPDFIEKMGWWPNYVHPMVNVTETSSEEFVGFLDNPVRQTELKKSAGFN